MAETLTKADEPALIAARVRIAAGDVEGARAGLAAALESKAKSDAEEWRTLGYLETLRSVSAAIAAYEKARALDPGDFWTLIYLRRLYAAAGRTGDALEVARAAKAAAKDRRDVSVACNELGDVLRAQSDLPGALANYREGLDIRRALAKADPSNAERLRDVSVSLDRIGDVLRAQSDLPGALANYREGLDIRRALAKADPSNAERLRDIAMSLQRTGGCAAQEGEREKARIDWSEALAIVSDLSARDPSNGAWRRDVEQTQAMLAGL